MIVFLEKKRVTCLIIAIIVPVIRIMISSIAALNMNFKDKIAVVTGGAQDIGRCITEVFNKNESAIQ